MHKKPVQNKKKKPNSMMKALMKASRDLDREADKQNSLVSAATALALHRIYKWNDNQVCEFFNAQVDVYVECSATLEKSMIQMCSEEAGVDLIREESDVTWEDLYYLNPEFEIVELEPQQLLYMRFQQMKWCRAQIMAGVILTAKRKYDFDDDALGELFIGISEILKEYEGNIDRLREQCKKEVGFWGYKDVLLTKRERKVDDGQGV